MTTKKPTQYELNRAKYEPIARAAAIKHGYDPELFVRQINQESGFNPVAKSGVGAQGIAQIMPMTAKGWKVNPADPVASLDAAAKNMASYYSTYKRNGHDDTSAKALALAAYNAGPGNVARYGTRIYGGKTGIHDFDGQTTHYVANIMGHPVPSTDTIASAGLQTAPAKKPQSQPQASPSWLDGLVQTASNFIAPPAQAEELPPPPSAVHHDPTLDELNGVAKPKEDDSFLQELNGVKPPVKSNDPMLDELNGATASKHNDDEFLKQLNGTAEPNDPLEMLGRTGQLLGNAGAGLVKSTGDFANQFIEAGKSGALTNELHDYLDPGGALMSHPQQAIERPLAAATGILKGVRDLAQGVNALPADTVNAAQYIIGGKISDPKVPLGNLPDISDAQKQLLQRNLVSGTAGQLLPLALPVSGAAKIAGGLDTLAGKMTSSILQSALKAVAKPGIVGTAIEGALGATLDPGQGLTPQQRIESRLGQAESTALGTGAGFLAGRVVKTVSAAHQVQEVMNELRVSKETAQQIVASGNHKAAMDLSKANKIAPQGLLPEQTGQYKKLDVIGDRAAALNHLQTVAGYDVPTAHAALQQAETLQGQRAKVPHYVQVQRLDDQINQVLARDSAPVPTKPNQVKIIGGKKALKVLQDAPIVARSRQLAQHIGVTPVEARVILDGAKFPQEILGQNAYLTTPQAIASRVGLLTEGRLLNTTKTGQVIWKQVAEHIPALNDATQNAMSTLNGIRDDMIRSMKYVPSFNNKILRTANDLALDIGQHFSNSVKDGTVARIMSGDTIGLDPAVVTKLQPFADRLVEYNKTHIIPNLAKMSGLPETHFDPTKISNAQSGSKFFTLNLKELASKMAPADFNNFVSKWNSGSDPTNPKVSLGLGNDLKEAWQHLADRKADYEREFPFFYNKDGSVNKEMVASAPNSKSVQSDLGFYNRLDKGQLIKLFSRKADFVNDMLPHSSLSKADLSAAYDEVIAKGNTRGTSWSKFVGSLQSSNNKLIFKNADPFKEHWRQTVDLAKKEHLEPIINTIEGAQKLLQQRMIDDFGPTTNPATDLQQGVLKGKLKAEHAWYEDLKDMYKRTPSQLDQWAADAADTAFTGGLKDQALKISRRWGDNFVGVQSLAKLAMNIPAAVSNLTEAVVGGMPELHGKDYHSLLTELGTKHPVVLMKDLIAETKSNPRFKSLLYTHDTGTGAGFAGSNKFFGSHALGGFKEMLMYPFSQGTTGGKLISYKIFKTIGENQGFKGPALDDFIVNQMVKNKAIPELDRIPLQAKTQIGKVALLLQSYLVRVTDLAAQHYKSALDLPSPENIRKAMMFDLAPALLFGGQASVTGSILSKVVDTTNAMTDIFTGDRHDPMWDDLKARNSFLAKGLIGYTGLDTSFFTRDPSSVANLGGGLVASTAKDVGNLVRDVGMANRNPATKEHVIPEAVGKFVKNEIISVKRLANAADIERTGQYLDSQGQPIMDAGKGAQKHLDAASAALGFKNADVVGVQARRRSEMNSEHARQDDAKFLHDELQGAIMNRDGEYSRKLIKALVGKTLTLPDLDGIQKVMSQLHTPADQRYLDNLSMEAGAVMRHDPKMKPIIDIINQNRKRLSGGK